MNELANAWAPDAQSRDRDWLIPVTVILAVVALAWLAMFGAGLVHAPLIGAYEALAGAALLPVLCWRMASALRRLGGQPRRPQRLWREVTQNPARVGAVFAGTQLFVLGAALFGALKAGIPKVVPFWLDAPLARAERALFGLDPWLISNHLLGWATPAIDVIYATFLPGHLLAVFALLTAAPSRVKAQALVSLFLVWSVVGVGGAYALSSAGPIFFDRAFGGDTFAALNAAMSRAPIMLSMTDVMWQAHATDTPLIATGISAMPSMHVGLTLWLALLARGSRWAPLAWVYYALIWLGSVHLGWHYVSDGLVASLGVLLLWWATAALAGRSAG